MTKYREYMPSEMGLTKTDWTWFPCVYKGEKWYSNGHVLMVFPPVKNFPEERPAGASRWLSGGELFDVTRIVDRIEVSREEARAVKAFERVSIPSRKDYFPGLVQMESDTVGPIYIARHYHSLVMKTCFGRSGPPLIKISVEHVRHPVTYHLQGTNDSVAVVMPIDLTEEHLRRLEELGWDTFASPHLGETAQAPVR